MTERDELVGRFREGSRLPQYLMTAILTGAVVLARYISLLAIVLVDSLRTAPWS